MADFSKITRSGTEAVNTLSTSPLQHCQPHIQLGNAGQGFFCECEALRKYLMQGTSETSISKGGCIALLALAGTFVGRAWAKYLHKKGDLSCYTYRKIKDMTLHQPWFCIPLLAVPLVNYHRLLHWRPPSFTYVLLVGGWMLNTSGHVLALTTKDDRVKSYTIPVSYVSLALAGAVAVMAVFMRKGATTC